MQTEYESHSLIIACLNDYKIFLYRNDHRFFYLQRAKQIKTKSGLVTISNNIHFIFTVSSLTYLPGTGEYFLILLLLYEATQSARNIQDKLNIITAKDFSVKEVCFRVRSLWLTRNTNNR